MPRQAGTVLENNFVQGLITEFTALRFPPNACVETFDCIFDETGRVTRRFAFDLETDYVLEDTTVTDGIEEVVTEFLWSAVSGDGDTNFLVVQHGSLLHFYDISDSVIVSDSKKTFTVDLDTYLATGSGRDPAQFPCQYANGNGDLIVVSRAIDPIAISYSIIADTISVTSITLKERDIYGIDDGLTLTERVTESVASLVTDEPEHYYNILNQGWHAGDALSQWDTARTDMPSNADIVSLYRSSDTDAFDNSIFTSKVGPNSPAPRGHFILDVFDRDRTQALVDEGFSAAAGVPTEVAIPDGDGTVIGNGNGGSPTIDNANAFDTDQTVYVGRTPSDLYVGKDFGLNPKKIAKVIIKGRSGSGSDFFWNGTSGAQSITLQLRASNSAPSAASDGTLLGTTTFTEDNADREIASTDTGNTYRYVWVRNTSSLAVVGYVQFFSFSEVVSLSGDDTIERPRAVEFFASRVWYGGINKDGLSNSIYFSQIIEDESQYGKCYQKNDPTGEDFFDLLPDDGGVVRIPEMGSVRRMMALQNSLLIFASNGVWLISGSGGFAANDFSVKKLSNIGTNSPYSFVQVRGLPLWWAEDGIFTMNYDPNFDSFSVIPVSDETIRSFVVGINPSNRKFVKGSYDSENNVVTWLYNTSTSLAEADEFKYDAALSLNVQTNAFYPWTIGSTATGPEVRGIVYVSDAERNDDPIFKYTTTIPDSTSNVKVTFSDTTSTSYKDWTEYATNVSADTDDEVDYISYFITGYRLDGEAQRFFQAPYVFVYLETQTDASCFMQPVFDFTNSGNSGKWGTKQQVYNSALTLRDVNYRRLKVRGKGRSLQLKFQSESGKPFTLIGWSMRETANADL